MKTFIYALTLVLFTLLKFNLQAQTTNCADISVQVIYPNPQSPGQFEYGARVILDRSYNEDIVVNGSISPNNGGFSFLFSVTVPAGQAMAQTQYLLQSTTALNPTISVLQISPTNVTSGGVTYNTQGFAGNCNTQLNRYKSFLNANPPNENKPNKLIMGVYRADYYYDIDNTIIENVYDSINSRSHVVYVTPITLQSEIIGNLFGIVAGVN